MKIKVTKNLACCPACDTPLVIPGLQRCDICGIECYSEVNETDHTAAQARLLQSWGMVLREQGSGSPGGGHW
jgi:hypothetical protein